MNKKIAIVTAAVLGAVMTGGLAFAHGNHHSAEEQRNMETAVAFYTAAIKETDFEKAKQYIGNQYKQHNPSASDGPEGLKNFLAFAKQNGMKFDVEIKRVMADGDMVILHNHVKSPTGPGSAVIDIFRLENGKVVEHWDVGQAIPEKPANNNTMF